VALDRGPKLRTYERHGVLEYLIWRVDDSLFEWYILRDNGFELLPPSVDGIFRSETFPVSAERVGDDEPRWRDGDYDPQ
jgi:Uma2 family endonuclease